MCTLWLVILSLGALGGLVSWYCCLPMGMQTPWAPSGLAITSPLGYPCSVQCLAVCIWICIGQALAEHLRRYLYQALVSKCFLAIVSGFGVCRWDGSFGGGSLWMAFPSVSAPRFGPSFSLNRNNFVLTFLNWEGGPIPKPRTVPNLRIWSLQLSLPFVGYFRLGPGSLLLSGQLGFFNDYPQFPIPHCYIPPLNFLTLCTSLSFPTPDPAPFSSPSSLPIRFFPPSTSCDYFCSPSK